jgi:Calcineurin-like phosphoesterase
VNAAPQRIAVAGDWHGSIRHARHLIGELPHLLPAEPAPYILHLGDFGIWPGIEGAWYVDAVLGALLACDARLWFVDGNHEDFAQLEGFRVDDTDSKLLAWLPRGHRWQWHGRTWLACGGGVSVDKAGRTEGRDWWPEEEITDEQEAAIIAGGPADVLVAHDCPSGVVHCYPPPPSWWSPADLARSGRHQERLQRIVDAVQPSWIMHGHLHMAYQRTCDFGYGPVEVTGLDCAGGKGPNWAVLDAETMTWGVTG